MRAVVSRNTAAPHRARLKAEWAGGPPDRGLPARRNEDSRDPAGLAIDRGKVKCRRGAATANAGFLCQHARFSAEIQPIRPAVKGPLLSMLLPRQVPSRRPLLRGGVEVHPWDPPLQQRRLTVKPGQSAAR